MAQLRVLLFSEHPPYDPGRPADGLAVRHARIAEALAGQGVEVTFAFPADRSAPAVREPAGVDVEPVADPAALALWLRRHRPDVVVLGYFELADWIPADADIPLVLDYVAPRMLERLFEDRSRLSDDARRLIHLLGRCREVWVGHRKQADLLLPWLLQAGHDLRFHDPVRVVPISAPIRKAGPAIASTSPGGSPPAGTADSAPRTAFHGGRNWPWRDSRRWISAVRESVTGWTVESAGESTVRSDGPSEPTSTGLLGFDRYCERLAACDVLLELCDENIERRYSLSFRMTDALCLGVPVIANRFLPVADAIERHGAGWLVDDPEELTELLERLASDPKSLRLASLGALALAREAFDADRNYAALADALAVLVSSPEPPRPQPLDLAATDRGGSAWRHALAVYARQWVHHRVRMPVHRLLKRLAAKRPRSPSPDQACWVVVSRPDLFPTDHGAAVKIERTAWGLSHHVGQVVLLTDRRDRYWIFEAGERRECRFPFWLRLLGWPRAVNLLRLMAKGLPYADAFLYLPLVDRGLHARLLWLLRRFPVEVVQAEFPAYAHPAVWSARRFGTRSVLVEHNVEFQRIADQVPELGERGARLLKRTEVDLANACDHVITVSDRDRDDLIAAGVREGQVVTIPHGVDLERFAQADPVDLRQRFDLPDDHAVLVYHGIYSYPPNLKAVEELSSKLLPVLARRGVRASVVAFGPEPPERGRPGVRFAGPVDDLAGHLKGADLAVIPLRAGGGTRMKILDDFAAGVAVVTTSKGAEGLPVADGEQLRIVDDPEEMADVVRMLLADDRARDGLAERATEWVSSLDWRAIAGRYVARVRGGD